MGNLYRAACPCGYEVEDLVEGYGMAGVGYAIASCARCRAIVVAKTGETVPYAQTFEPVCPGCGDDVALIKDPGGLKACPSCGEATLTLEPAGLWD